MLTANDIIARVRYTLLDPNGVGWSDAELLSYLNAAMSQVLVAKPDAIPEVVEMGLNPGVYQVLPADGAILMDAYRNGVDGVVTVQPLHEFIRTTPTWATQDAGATEYVLTDPRSPRTFHVSPPATSGMTLWILMGKIPTRVATLADAIELPSWFETALWAMVVGMAYAKNCTRQNLAKSAQFIGLFNQYVPITTAAQQATGAAPDVMGER